MGTHHLLTWQPPRKGVRIEVERKWGKWEARGRGIPQDLVTLGSLD